MSKLIVIGGAVAVTLVVVFLFYRQLNKGNTKTQAELKHPGMSPVEAAKFEFEELTRKFFRKMITAMVEFRAATTPQQIQSATANLETIGIDGNLELKNMSRVVHEDFGIVMLPPAGADVDRMSLEEVDDIEFTWGSCAPDGVIRSCQTELRRARGDFE